MKRSIDKQLVKWKDATRRLPLLIRGARQVGKSFAVQELARHFKQLVTIDFERKPEFASLFHDLDPKKIVQQLELVMGERIVPGETLLFFDEIQACPRAITALRYFKEQLPELHIIAAGSLLEFALSDVSFSFPVGRIQPIYMRPLSFLEFLSAINKEVWVDAIERASVDTYFSEPVHQQLLEAVKQYMLVGGMPAAVQAFVESNSFIECQRVQSGLLETYQADFSKYATATTHRYLNRFFERAPALVGEFFKYVQIDPDAKSRDLKQTLEQLEFAGLLSRICATSAAGLPLHSQAKAERFKLLFLDIGLLQRSLRIDVSKVLSQPTHAINSGNLMEQWVGQELLAIGDIYEKPRLHYWHRETRTSTAEVDYVVEVDGQVVPVEVKSGKTGRLKSLQIFLDEKKAPLGVRISQMQTHVENRVLSLPFYLTSQLNRLALAK